MKILINKIRFETAPELTVGFISQNHNVVIVYYTHFIHAYLSPYLRLILFCFNFQMTAAIERVHRALANIKIDHKEAIVVPFRIP